MVGVSDCDGECVRRVWAGDRRAWEQPRDHRVDLHLFGIAVADHRFLDEPGCIFTDCYAGASRNHDDNAARLAELERRLRVLVDEHFLDRGAFGLMLGDQCFELAGEVGEPLGQRRGASGLEVAVGEVRQAVRLGSDQAPAGRAEPRVEAEDFQASFSSSSSGTS